MDCLKLYAFAKINLGLLILRKREDGYHDIATVFQQIDLSDRIEFGIQPAEITLKSSGIEIPLDSTNLMVRAFQAFRDVTGVDAGIHMSIQKNIPTGGGLGGGSSDAACTLVAANRLFGRPLSASQMADIALGIGSDVPFFLTGGTAFGTGRGEQLESMTIGRDYHILLLLPQVSVSTAWAYKQAKIGLTNAEKLSNFKALFNRFETRDLRSRLVNDFEEAVFQRHPELCDLKNELYKQGAFYASMSGSGSTLYGLYDTEEEAGTAQAFFSMKKGIDVYICRPCQVSDTAGEANTEKDCL